MNAGRTVRALAVALLVGTAACTSSGGGDAPESSTPVSTVVKSTPPPADQVHVLGLWSGPEYDSFDAVRTAWEKQTGGSVAWESSDDIASSLDADEQAGTPPDIAVLPNLQLMRQLAADGKLVPLDGVLDMHTVHADYPATWTDLGSVDTTLYGLFYKVTDKSTVWYSPKAFAAHGYRVPTTWSQFMALAARIRATGSTPFSIVSASGPASGWPLTDWISQLVLAACGPEVYDGWIAADVPWTNGCIKHAFQQFLTLVVTRGNVRGGVPGVLSTGDSDGGTPLYTDPPQAYFYYLASFAQAFIATAYPDLRAGPDYDVFDFPTVNPAYAGSVMIGADVLVMVHDTPAARSFLGYLAGAKAQEVWIERGGFTSVSREVDSSTYADPVSRKIASDLSGADVIRFAAGDMMPTEMQHAWWAAMLDLVEHPARLDATLASLTDLAKQAK